LVEHLIRNALLQIQGLKDSGHGIISEQLENIFNPYFNTKQRGSGLGLSVCNSIIKSHNGMIVAESEPNTGTIFSFYLPATDEQSSMGPLKITNQFKAKIEYSF